MGCSHFTAILGGHRCTIRMNYAALRRILILANCTDGLIWWRLPSSDIAFEDIHSASIKYQAADAFLQLATIGKDTSLLEDDIKLLGIGTRIPRTHQQAKKICLPAFVTATDTNRLLRAQASSTYCDMLHAQIFLSDSKFNVNSDCPHIQTSRIDRAIKIAVSPFLRQRIHMLWHRLKIAGRSGQPRMYDTKRREFKWHSKVADVKIILSKCKKAHTEKYDIQH